MVEESFQIWEFGVGVWEFGLRTSEGRTPRGGRRAVSELGVWTELELGVGGSEALVGACRWKERLLQVLWRLYKTQRPWSATSRCVYVFVFAVCRRISGLRVLVFIRVFGLDLFFGPWGCIFSQSLLLLLLV